MRSITLTPAHPHGTHALIFESDDEVVSTLEAFAEDQDVRGAHFTALGAFRSATLAYFDWETKEYRDIPVEEQVEVVSLVGDIGRKEDGSVVVHAHCVLGRRDGSTVAGHLMEAAVRPTLELFLQVAPTELSRRPDEESGLDLIRP